MNSKLDIVDDHGNIIGNATREECHSDPSLIHRVVHIMVFNSKNEILLQLRGKDKLVQPDRWDTSVGGHLEAGENYDEGAARELEEELGVKSGDLVWMYDYLWRTRIETELVRTWRLVNDGPFKIQAEEIQEARFFTPSEIESNLGKNHFTPNFEEEWRKYLRWSDQFKD